MGKMTCVEAAHVGSAADAVKDANEWKTAPSANPYGQAEQVLINAESTDSHRERERVGKILCVLTWRDVSEKGGMWNVHQAPPLIFKRKANTYTYLLIFWKRNENETKSHEKEIPIEERKWCGGA